jgi:hypothetical protein
VTLEKIASNQARACLLPRRLRASPPSRASPGRGSGSAGPTTLAPCWPARFLRNTAYPRRRRISLRTRRVTPICHGNSRSAPGGGAPRRALRHHCGTRLRRSGTGRH